MPHFASFARLGLSTTVALVLASACGGQSFTGGGDGGGDAGSVGKAGRSAGGSTGNHAGTANTAGKGHAGTGAGGSSSAGTGAGGSGSAGTGAGGGSGAPGCFLPPSSGNCEAYIPSWYHDPSTGICRPFVYGGCDGNANRYASLEACQKACPSGSPNYDACKSPTDCMVTGTGCCGICDSANVTLHDLIAYNKQYAGLLQCGVALDAAGGAASAGAAAPIACAPCPAPPAGQGTLKYFVPNCVAGQCVVEDLRTSAVTACTLSTECKLRNGLGCCEGCGGGEVVSVRKDGSFEELVCGDLPVLCPGCLPATPSGMPYCLEGRCTVAISATD